MESSFPMTSENPIKEVRTFETEQEIRDLPGFVENNPVDQDNYRELVGDYHFAQKMRCCLKRTSGVLCQTPHNYGFVVRLTDRSISIIGNACGATKFDAESKLSRDKALFLNLKKRRDTQQRIAELLSGKEQALARIWSLLDDLTSMESRMAALLARFGETCSGQLRQLSYGGSGSIVVFGIKIRTGELDGKKIVERDKISIPVGVLRGTLAFRSDIMRNCRADLRQIVLAFHAAQSFNDDVKTSVLEKTISIIADLDRMLEAGRQFIRAESEFLTCDWSPLPFLARHESERTKLAREVLNRTQSGVGRDKAKQWLHTLEAELRSKYGVDRLETAY